MGLKVHQQIELLSMNSPMQAQYIWPFIEIKGAAFGKWGHYLGQSFLALEINL